ncbi:Uncharacterised protein [Vibrio cholerae]|uniref:Uncharacterized protein n=1 Tax=Vibrio cholerae TaxID=666 RepID=A0A655NVP8_VIBCL|nr:Uncharacterised protein [Vibrio cholerae]CRZ94956.1 Uncharacterised protein [Vibrio cholerae]CSB20992.1 Uncharacterised protein [Vibrio cholerae]CSB21717.1 Uncharacterised protein [Vibrio cholerae]CSD23965.1 Uncharacterised protein [Vibrio cholerae]
MANQLCRIVGEQLTKMSGEHSGRIDHGIAQSLRMLTLIFPYPHCIQTKSRVASALTINHAVHLSRVNRQLLIWPNFCFTHGYAHQGDAVTIGR